MRAKQEDIAASPAMLIPRLIAVVAQQTFGSRTVRVKSLPGFDHHQSSYHRLSSRPSAPRRIQAMYVVHTLTHVRRNIMSN